MMKITPSRLGCLTDTTITSKQIVASDVCLSALRARPKPEDCNEYDIHYTGGFPETLNQGQKPRCVTHAVESILGYLHPDSYRMYSQKDRFEIVANIYNRAKEIDGLGGDGTTLSAGIQAARDLGYLTPDIKTVRLNTVQKVLDFLNWCPILIATKVFEGGWSFNFGLSLVKTKQALEKRRIRVKGDYVDNHATVLTGKQIYENTARIMDMDKSWCPDRNSWGINWGINGYAAMPVNVLQQTFLDAYAVYKER